jgi:hypothetical protein
MKHFVLYFISILLIISTLSNSCRKPVDEEAKLTFSSSTVNFDTVFTTLGSMTKRFTVKNRHKFPMKVDIHLASGSTSYYSINVDGRAGISFKEIEIAPQDSIFVFVKVTINPGQINTPFLVTDSIIFRSGRIEQDVDLVAYGQDAHFIVADNQSFVPYKLVAGAHETVHFTNDKPWVIYGFAAVDSLGTLIIDEGAKIYFHKNSGLWIYREGCLQVNGTAANPVLFRGDRINDHSIDKKAGQWSRIWLMESSRDSEINHAIIANAEVGIDIQSLVQRESGKIFIRNCLIKQSYFQGVQIRNAEVHIENTIIANSEEQNAMSVQIGDVTANHVTIGNYANTKSAVALLLQNYYMEASIENGAIVYTQYEGNTNVNFNNSIIYGSFANEWKRSIGEGTTSPLNYRFENCLVRSETINDANFINCIHNKDPKFNNIDIWDFKLQQGSPAINAGKTGLGISIDYAGNPRDGQPDIGAYEFGGN